MKQIANLKKNTSKRKATEPVDHKKMPSKKPRTTVDHEDLSSKKPQIVAADNQNAAVNPHFDQTDLQTILGQYYDRLRNPKMSVQVEDQISLDTQLFEEVMDKTRDIDANALTARIVQLFKNRYIQEKDKSICLFSPHFFTFADIDKNWVYDAENLGQFFITKYEKATKVIIPILTGDLNGGHCTLATLEIEQKRKRINATCNYYDSLRFKIKKQTKEYLEDIANFLAQGQNCTYNFNDKSESSDKQFDHVNCAAFTAKNAELYLENGEVTTTDLTALEKRYEFLQGLAEILGQQIGTIEQVFGDSVQNATMEESTDSSEDANASKREKDRERKRRQRELIEPEERKKAEREGKQARRSKIDPDERKEADRKYQKSHRESMDPEELKKVEREGKKSRRSKMDPEELRKIEREGKRIQRSKKVKGELQIADNENECDVEEIPEYYLGEMDVKCESCRALHFKQEPIDKKAKTFSSCCAHGKVNLPVSEEDHVPKELTKLFDGSHEMSKEFFKNIRQYNRALGFASVITKNVTQKGGGPYAYRQLGDFQRAFNTNAAQIDGEEKPSYGQLYMIETHEAHGIRMQNNPNLNPSLLSKLEAMMQDNAFTKSYVMLKEQIEIEKKKAEKEAKAPPDLKLLFSVKPGTNMKRYNLPRVNEVAAVYVEGPNGEPPPAYISVNEKGSNKLKILKPCDPSVEPMLYPLFNIKGKLGWNVNMKKSNDRRLTQLEYVQYKIAIRKEKDLPFNPLHYGEKLTQEWFVDLWLRVDRSRLDYNQHYVNEKLSTAYESVNQYLEQKAEELGAQLGKKIILPASYIGSPRYMSDAYDDAMGMVRFFGKPDVFVTMTCNPKWKEITENLLDGQSAEDRPDIVARVFRLKYKAMIQYVKESGIFGKVISYVGTIEFQKRGLPHVHLLFTLEDKVMSPETIDKWIRAEIPDKELEPRLYEIVTKNNVHSCVKYKQTPKGTEISRYMPCCSKEDPNCSKKFPKQYVEQTEFGKGGYAKYRRRKDGNVFKTFDGQEIDNSRVVPYSPRLSIKFNCHINVEHVSDVDVVKYLYKYIFKGPDQATILKQKLDPSTGNKLILEYDEISAYIDARYLSAPEAAWRLFESEIVVKSHHVEKLDIHLENQHKVFLKKDATDTEIEEAKDKKKSKLMAFFELNTEIAGNKASDKEFRNLRYMDMPRKFTWNTKGQKWNPRKAYFNTVGRIYAVSPKQSELFHLRLLLLNVGGPTSFTDLKTFEGKVYATFKTACLARGLIDNDEEYIKAMEETAGYKMPAHLRFFFAMLLIHCNPAYPQELYDKFKEHLSHDYIKKFKEEAGIKIAYRKIEEILFKNEAKFADFGMAASEEIDESTLAKMIENGAPIKSDLSPEECAEKGAQNVEKMNEEQKAVVTNILEAVDDYELKTNCYFIDGPGGTGKTYIYTTLNYLLKARGKKVMNMAHAGIAANLLPNGCTIHSAFKMGLDIDQYSTSNIEAGTVKAKRLAETDVFIIDEASMVSIHVLNLIDRTLREFTRNVQIPFGGKIMLFGGDFRQTLPIVENANAQQTMAVCLKRSELWNKFTVFKLVKNMRAGQNEQEFAQTILDIGEGKLNDKDETVELPKQCLFNGDLSKEVFATKITDENIEMFLNRAILAPTNNEVDKINEEVLKRIEGEEKIYLSADEICEQDKGKHRYVVELLNTLNPTSIPKHELKLKRNAIVMLIRNLDINSGLCNGTRMRVLEMREKVLMCEIISGDRKGETVFIPRIKIECTKGLPVTFYRKQFPIRLAFAMTINKSQGQTLGKVGLKLDSCESFSHGQLYVALSRVKNWESLRIKLNKESKGRAKNIVYTEIL